MLAKGLGRLSPLKMNGALKASESADYRRGLGIFLTETPPTDTPKHLSRPLFPRNPFFPRLRSGHRLFQGPPAQSKFLAVAMFLAVAELGASR